MKTFFTADPHYGDDYILENGKRPHNKSNKMDRLLIKNHNEVVGEKDTIYINGDFSSKSYQDMNYYKSIVKQLNGKKILILGNHDPLKPFTYVYELGFWSVHTSLEITIDGIDLIICHDISASCIDRSKVFIGAHIHDFFKVYKNVINVGVDAWNYKPVSLEELKPYIIEIKKNGGNYTI